MKWGEIQIESLKKMFLNKDVLDIDNLDSYKTAKKYKIYLDSMPQACNEALLLIDSLKEPDIHTYNLIKNNNDIYDLKELIPNYKKMIDIICPKNSQWQLKSSNILKVDDWYSGDITILYKTKIDYINSDTEDDKQFLLNEDYCKIIPLYIAGQLYKDDDLALSTTYLNEFNNLLEILISADKVNNNPSISSIYRME